VFELGADDAFDLGDGRHDVRAFPGGEEVALNGDVLAVGRCQLHQRRGALLVHKAMNARLVQMCVLARADELQVPKATVVIHLLARTALSGGEYGSRRHNELP